MADDQTVSLAHVPRLQASSFQVAMTGTDCMLVLGQLTPNLTSGQFGEPTAHPIGILTISPHAAKELAYILHTSVTAFEAEFGELRTPFLNSLSK